MLKGAKDSKKKAEVKYKSLQDKYESDFVKEKLNGFDHKNCKAWLSLTERFGPKISQNQLLSLAEVISEQLNIGLYREYKRRKEMLIKWFDENYDSVWPFVEKHLAVINTDGVTI